MNETVQLFGPIYRPAEEYRVLVDGCEVPLLMAAKQQDGTFHLFLDRRFMMDEVTEEELKRWAWFIANAQAIGAGWSCHGPNGRQANPYAVQSVCLDGTEATVASDTILREVE